MAPLDDAAGSERPKLEDLAAYVRERIMDKTIQLRKELFGTEQKGYYGVDRQTPESQSSIGSPGPRSHISIRSSVDSESESFGLMPRAHSLSQQRKSEDREDTISSEDDSEGHSSAGDSNTELSVAKVSENGADGSDLGNLALALNKAQLLASHKRKIQAASVRGRRSVSINHQTSYRMGLAETPRINHNGNMSFTLMEEDLSSGQTSHRQTVRPEQTRGVHVDCFDVPEDPFCIGPKCRRRSRSVDACVLKSLIRSEVSPDLEELVQLAMASQYAGKRYHAAACTIQRYYREYKMQKKWEDIQTKGRERPALGAPGAEGLSRMKTPDKRKSMGSDAVLLQAQAAIAAESVSSISENDIATAAAKQVGSHESLVKSSESIKAAVDTSAVGVGKLNLDPVKSKLDTRVGVCKFNRTPVKGIQFLIERRVLKEQAFQVAKFLHEQQGLATAMVGEYLGEPSQFVRDVLKYYIEMMDFGNLLIDEALRKFMQKFRLPGEAQKIDRIMQTFADVYHLQNPMAFKSPDTAYVLSFSIIMLNTDLHNPNVRKRMTLEDFVRNNRGIDEGGDIDRDFLTEIYKSIKEDEIITNHDHTQTLEQVSKRITGKCPNFIVAHRQLVRQATFNNIVNPGKPNKRHHPRTLWLFNDMLIISKPLQKQMGNKSPTFDFRNMVSLVGLNVVVCQASKMYNHAFQIMTDRGDLVLMVDTRDKELRDAFVKDLQAMIDEVAHVEEVRMEQYELLMERTQGVFMLPNGTMGRRKGVEASASGLFASNSSAEYHMGGATPYSIRRKQPSSAGPKN
eukprot:Clim_evm63s207 gene=Clim_evmTU63s207